MANLLYGQFTVGDWRESWWLDEIADGQSVEWQQQPRASHFTLLLPPSSRPKGLGMAVVGWMGSREEAAAGTSRFHIPAATAGLTKMATCCPKLLSIN